MATIVTRAGKGSALTWTEGDSNFTNLNTAKLENVVEDTTPQLGGNLDVNDFDIRNASGPVVVTVAGVVGGSSFKVTDGTSNLEFSAVDGQFDSSAATGLVLTTSATNASIEISPNGTGDVNLTADTVRIGDAGATATLTTNSTGNLVLNTNAGTNSGSITIAQGANASITIAPNGTGNTIITGPSFGIITNTSGSSSITGRHSAIASSSTGNYSINVQKHRTDILLAAMTDEPAVVAFSVRDSGSNNRVFGRLIGRYSGTGTNPSFTFQHSVDGFSTTSTAATIGGGTAIWGATNSAYTHTTNGTGDITINTNSGTNSGSIVIANGANGNLSLTPNGTGKTVITNAVPYEYVYTGGSTTGTITPNAANGTVQSITLTGSITFNAFTTPLAGQSITMLIKQPSSGGPYTLTSSMLFAGGSKTLSTTANAVDMLTVLYDGTNYWASLAKAFA